MSRAEFQAIYDVNRRVAADPFIVYYREQPREGDGGPRRSRLGVCVSRKMGGAVQRNRIKRLLREAWRLSAPRIVDGYDVVLNSRWAARDLTLVGAGRALKAALTEAGIWREFTPRPHRPEGDRRSFDERRPRFERGPGGPPRGFERAPYRGDSDRPREPGSGSQAPRRPDGPAQERRIVPRIGLTRASGPARGHSESDNAAPRRFGPSEALVLNERVWGRPTGNPEGNTVREPRPSTRPAPRSAPVRRPPEDRPRDERATERPGERARGPRVTRHDPGGDGDS